MVGLGSTAGVECMFVCIIFRIAFCIWCPGALNDWPLADHCRCWRLAETGSVWDEMG